MSNDLSFCCSAIRKAISGNEGTGYYICSVCGKEFISEDEADAGGMTFDQHLDTL